MAQTWPVTRRRRALLKAIDAMGRTLASRPDRTRAAATPSPSRVLVIEPWHIGDVVLATPLLACLRQLLPAAHVAILAKPFAEEILRYSGLVDEVVPFDLPWTAKRNKYPLRPRVAKQVLALLRDLRARDFDVTIDARMDIRSNFLVAMTGAPRRVGYAVGGGGWLLTDTLPDLSDRSHRVDDWLALLPLVVGEKSSCRDRPSLVVTREERKSAKDYLEREGRRLPVIAYHPGGSHVGKRWPLAHFHQLAARLRSTHGGTHLVFIGPGEEENANGWSADTVIVRPSLRELMGLVSCSDVLICNDSGPMHIADAVGTPVVAIFEVGNPAWFGPSGDRATVIVGERGGVGVSAAPIDRPPRHPVEVTVVLQAVLKSLPGSRLAKQ